MNYVMSDIHGCYDKYCAMLGKIKFSDGDVLYILGDVLDRGPEGMKVLLDIAKHENIILLRGNHDQWALNLLSNLYRLLQEEVPDELKEQYRIWLSYGGNATVKEFLELNEDEQEKVFEVLSASLIYKEIEVNGVTYFMAHTVPEKEKFCCSEDCTIEDFLMGEPDYEEQYFPDKIIITGHTPTGFIDETSKGKIWMHNNHIAVDCGAVFGNPLGCLCLESYEEVYVR